MLLEAIGELKNKINELEETNQFYTMYDDWEKGKHTKILINDKNINGTCVNVNGTYTYIPINLPKNIQCVNIIINSNVKRDIRNIGFKSEYDPYLGYETSSFKSRRDRVLDNNNFGPDFNLNIYIELTIRNNYSVNIGVVSSSNYVCGLDKYSIEFAQGHDEICTDIFKFIKFKKIIINCQGDMYNNVITQSIINFLMKNIIKSNGNIEAQTNNNILAECLRSVFEN